MKKESSKILHEYVYIYICTVCRYTRMFIYTFRYTPLLHCCLKAVEFYDSLNRPPRPCSCCFGVRIGAEARHPPGVGNAAGKCSSCLMVGLFVGCCMVVGCSFFFVSYFFYFSFLDARCLF